MKNQYNLQTSFVEVETTEEHKGYTYGVQAALPAQNEHCQ